MILIKRNSENIKNIKTKKNKTKKIIGGKLLGYGAHGIAYNVGDSEGESFYKIIKRSPIKSLKIYSSDGFFKSYSSPDAILEFTEYIKHTENKIAKILKPTKTINEDFEIELAENRRVIDIFDEFANTYLTIYPLSNIFGKDVIGIVVTFINDNKIYAIFGNKCENNYSMNLDKFIVDILESIEILQINSYQHNDIKLDNIVKCGDRYKLIDWAQCALITDTKKIGSLIGTSPMRWYINGYSSLISKSLISYRTTMRNYGFSRSDYYKRVVTRILNEFDREILVNPDHSYLATKYAYSFDIFMLGMAILNCVYKYKLDFEKYKAVIFKFTSLKNPVKNAIEAKQFFIANYNNIFFN